LTNTKKTKKVIAIHLKENYSFKWYSAKGINVKGYVYDSKGKCLAGEALLAYFENIKNSSELLQLLKTTNGMFTVIILHKGTLMVAVDRLRYFPIFYAVKNANICISDTVESIKKHYDYQDINRLSKQIYLSTGFVPEQYTLVDNIFQVQAGQFVTFSDGKITTHNYFTYATSEIYENSYEDSKEKLQSIINNIFVRIKNTIGHRPIAVPLSSGFDSRLIAVMLKEVGLKEVTCISFETYNENERNFSEQIATRLGFKWKFIPLKIPTTKNFLHDKIFNDYVSFSTNYNSSLNPINYFIAKELKETLHPNTVIISGHSGDFFAGSHLYEEISTETGTQKLKLAIMKNYFKLLPPSAEVKKQFYTNFLNNENVGKLPYSIFESWILKESQSKITTNSIKAYNFFGFETRIPFWDLMFIDFFKHLPYHFKLYKVLYDDFVTNQIFAPYDLNFEFELQSTPEMIRKKHERKQLQYYLPYIFRNLFQKQKETSFITYLKKQISKEITRKNLYLYFNINNLQELIVQWYISEVIDAKKYS